MPDQVDHFLAEVRAEVARARSKFPGNDLTTIALMEEVGELAKALLDESPPRVRSEAVQVAAMAVRVAIDGDSSVAPDRMRKQPDGRDTVSKYMHPATASESTGLALIAAERARRVDVEGWTLEHDDAHENGELACAAAAYAVAWRLRQMTPTGDAPPIPGYWPWDRAWWKPTPSDRVRELVKAGALIVAEIDRLLRAAGGAKRSP